MNLKVGQKKKLDLKCVLKTDTTKEESIPSGTDVFWNVSRPGIINIQPDGSTIDIEAVKRGKVRLSALVSKSGSNFVETHVSSIDIDVEDDSIPIETKTGIIELKIKEKL